MTLKKVVHPPQCRGHQNFLTSEASPDAAVYAPSDANLRTHCFTVLVTHFTGTYTGYEGFRVSSSEAQEYSMMMIYITWILRESHRISPMINC